MFFKSVLKVCTALEPQHMIAQGKQSSQRIFAVFPSLGLDNQVKCDEKLGCCTPEQSECTRCKLEVALLQQHQAHDVKYFVLLFYLYNFLVPETLACVAWRFWLGELSNKGGRGQRNREEIGELLRPARQNRHATQATETHKGLKRVTHVQCS